MSLTALLALGAAGGCRENGGDIDDSLVSETQAALVAGYNGATTESVTSEYDLGGRFQSETSMAISTYNGNTVRIVAYNAQDYPPYETFDTTYRYYTTYASLMGWSFRPAASGNAWDYGNVYDMDLFGWNWTLVYGDPSIAAMPNTPNAYLANLASNKAFSTAMDPGKSPNPTETGLGNGGCVARSTDQGQTFHMWKCLSNANARYDGSSVVALSDSTGTKQRIYVAFHNMSTRPYPIDVWYYNETTGDFVLTPDPFPNYGIGSHPRLYSTNRYDGQLKVYLAAVDDGNQLLMNSHDGTSWGTPVVVAQGVQYQASVILKDTAKTTIKYAPGFAFAVGRSEYNNSIAEARFFYTKSANSRTFLQGVRCVFDGTACTSPKEWVTTQPSFPTGQSFSPAVDAGYNSANQWDWRVSYYTDNENVSTGQLKLYHGKPQATSVKTFYFSPRAATAAQTPCPNKRNGYWGDYDDMRADPAGNGIYYRMITDSTGPACDRSYPLRAIPQHVTEVTLPKI